MTPGKAGMISFGKEVLLTDGQSCGLSSARLSAAAATSAAESALARELTCSFVSSVCAATGVRGLYPGLSASIFRQMTYSVVRFGTYEYIKDEIKHQSRSLNLESLRRPPSAR